MTFFLFGCGQNSNQQNQEQAPEVKTPASTKTFQTEQEFIDFYNNFSNQVPENFSQKSQPTSGDLIAEIITTSGKISLKLFPQLAPKTVENFCRLALRDYYDGIIFHRVISGFMIQGGDPTGTGAGGESVFGKKFEDELVPELSNIRGSISMANAGQNTNGSQFFINQIDNVFLDGYSDGELKNCADRMVSCHSVFGQVFTGLDIVDLIAAVPTSQAPSSKDKPLKDIKIVDIKISQF